MKKRVTEKQERVLKLLEQNKEGLSDALLARKFKSSLLAMRKTLRLLTKEGYLTSTKKATKTLYQIKEDNKETEKKII